MPSDVASGICTLFKCGRHYCCRSVSQQDTSKDVLESPFDLAVIDQFALLGKGTRLGTLVYQLPNTTLEGERGRFGSMILGKLVSEARSRNLAVFISLPCTLLSHGKCDLSICQAHLLHKKQTISSLSADTNPGPAISPGIIAENSESCHSEVCSGSGPET
jgi:hypothetical protein